ncbi:hypothetical protein ACLK19_13800 [Escherichia coli]
MTEFARGCSRYRPVTTVTARRTARPAGVEFVSRWCFPETLPLYLPGAAP